MEIGPNPQFSYIVYKFIYLFIIIKINYLYILIVYLDQNNICKQNYFINNIF